MSLICGYIDYSDKDDDAIHEYILKSCSVLSTVFTYHDRFGFLNKFSKWNFPDWQSKRFDIEPVNHNFSEILEYIVRLYSYKGKKIYLMVSGGIDSMCLLCAFIKYGYKDITVLYTDETIVEYSPILEFLSKNKISCQRIPTVHTDIFMRAICQKGILLTGDCGNEVLGPISIAVYDDYNIYDWKDYLRKKTYSENSINQLEEMIKYQNLDIKTAYDLIWYLRFDFVCGYDTYTKKSQFAIEDNLFCPFFDNKFQEYTLYNIDKVTNPKHKDIPINDRTESRNFINSVLHDTWYIKNKPRTSTWKGFIRNNYLNSDNKTLIFTDKEPISVLKKNCSDYMYKNFRRNV